MQNLKQCVHGLTFGAREETPLSYLISDSDALSVSLFCFLVSLVSSALSCSLCSSLCSLSCNIREGVVPPNADKFLGRLLLLEQPKLRI